MAAGLVILRPAAFKSLMVEIQGLEPWTPCLQSRCSSQLSYIPKLLVLRLRSESFDSQIGLP